MKTSRRLSVWTAVFMLSSLLFIGAPAASAAGPDYDAQAKTLNALGLFLGTGQGFELERNLTRAEAAVMVVRLLGKETQAKQENNAHPFTDVPAWASPYIGYLYEYGVTTGTANTLYSAAALATPAQYATFMLRALGYSDKEGDFSWQGATAFLAEKRAITGEEAAALKGAASLSRGSAVSISRSVLLTTPKGSEYSLLHALYARDGVVRAQQISAAAKLDTAFARECAMHGVLYAGAGAQAMDSESIYAKASPAVFYIEVYEDEGDDEPWASGSGFFITSDGVAVTNYHVFEDSNKAVVKTSDGKSYPVDRLIAYSEELDLALFRVNGSFAHLDMGDPASLRTAQRIYCVGSPLGFEDTITDGLVSSAIKRYPQIENRELIQISTPISPGSSGGALLNEYGQVVGVTTYGTYGQNLNFAVPVTQVAELVWADPRVQLETVRLEREYDWENELYADEFAYDEESEEDNNTEATQTLEEGGIVYTGELSDGQDVDLYAFDTVNHAKEAFLRIRFKTAAVAAAARVELIDLDKEQAVVRSSQIKDTRYRLLGGHLNKGGRYVLRVSMGAFAAQGGFSLPYEFYCEIDDSQTKKIAYIFSEDPIPNESFDEAAYVPFGSMVEGKHDNASDKDYYTFTVDEQIKVSFVLIARDSEWRYTTKESLRLYNSAEKHVADIKATDIDSLAAAWNTRTLAPGTYYLEFVPGSADTTEYGLFFGSFEEETFSEILDGIVGRL